MYFWVAPDFAPPASCLCTPLVPFNCFPVQSVRITFGVNLALSSPQNEDASSLRQMAISDYSWKHKQLYMRKHEELPSNCLLGVLVETCKGQAMYFCRQISAGKSPWGGPSPQNLPFSLIYPL